MGKANEHLEHATETYSMNKNLLRSVTRMIDWILLDAYEGLETVFL